MDHRRSVILWLGGAAAGMAVSIVIGDFVGRGPRNILTAFVTVWLLVLAAYHVWQFRRAT